jgi:hypothetical protein
VIGRFLPLLLLAAVALPASASAQPTRLYHGSLSEADSQVSSNWAGYALAGTHTDGTTVSYTDVTASWVQPKVSCTSGASYSSFWVGLGGFASDSTALEQTGTESDCTAANKPVYSAWYEIVPAPSVPLKMKIVPGDHMSAAVVYQNGTVILQLTNLTRHARVTKRVPMTSPDLSSAEWIAEAPSECTSGGRCQTLPLANFGTMGFTNIAATADLHPGTLTDPTFSAIPIELAEQGPQSAIDQLVPQQGTPSGAVPGSPSADGRSFSVAWHPAGQ